jgi:hypothetical protein
MVTAKLIASASIRGRSRIIVPKMSNHARIPATKASG